MFETIDQSQRSNPWRRFSMLLISTGAHSLAILALVVLPLLFFSARGDLLTFVIASPQAPPAPAPQLPHNTKATAPQKVAIGPVKLLPPQVMPIGIPLPPEGPVFTGFTDVTGRNIEGVPGTIFGPPGGPGIGPQIAVVGPLPPPPRPAERKAAIRRGGDVLASKLVRKVEPVYPHLAKLSRVGGIVILQVTVDEEGDVSDIKILRGHPLLEEAAVQAVRQWKYSPTFLNGEPVPVTAAVTVIFSLR